jgi:hypothetical protein
MVHLKNSNIMIPFVKAPFIAPEIGDKPFIA